jgi:hypothetical protein
MVNNNMFNTDVLYRPQVLMLICFTLVSSSFSKRFHCNSNKSSPRIRERRGNAELSISTRPQLAMICVSEVILVLGLTRDRNGKV